MCLETSPPRATSLIIGSHSKQGMYLSLPMYLAFQWSYTYHVHCLRIFTWNSKADFETYIFTDVHDRKFKRNLSSNCLFSRVMILFPSKSGTTLHSVTWKTLEVKKDLDLRSRWIHIIIVTIPAISHDHERGKE